MAVLVGFHTPWEIGHCLRWQKRNTPNRTALLLSAMPDIKRRANLLMLSDLQGKELSTVKTQISLPYLNLETLSEDPITLLALLHHRSTARMSDWVSFDAVQLESSFCQGVLEASFNPHCVVMRGEGFDIGTLVFWNRDEAHRSQIIGYPLAKLILETQSILTTFLVRIVDSLLHSPVELASRDCPIWEPLFAMKFDGDGLDDAVPAPRRPEFCDAPAGHHQALRNILNNDRHDANRDDKWLLQTYPDSARQTLQSVKRFMLGDLEEDQSYIMILALLNSATRQVRWFVLRERADAILKNFDLDNTLIRADESPSGRRAWSLQVLDGALEAEFKKALFRTRTLAVQMGIYLESRNAHHQSPATLAKAKKNPGFWASEHMPVHSVPDKSLPRYYIALLEKEIASTQREGRFSQSISECLSDLSTLNEAIVTISYGHLDQGAANHAETHLEGTPRWFDMEHADCIERIWPALKPFLSTTASSGKVNQAALATFDAGHAALGDLWAATRVLWRHALVEDKCPEAQIEEFVKVVRAGLSMEYATELQHQRDMLVTEIERIQEAAEKRAPHARAITLRISPLHASEYQKNANSSTTVKSRIEAKSSPEPSPQSNGVLKVKTRSGLPPREIPDQHDAAIADISNITLSARISVCSVSMDVYRRMFVSFGKHSNSNLRWGEFVKAMLDAGFGATCSMGGSAVVFDDSRVQGAIRLHQPHPDPSINPIML